MGNVTQSGVLKRKHWYDGKGGGGGLGHPVGPRIEVIGGAPGYDHVEKTGRQP